MPIKLPTIEIKVRTNVDVAGGGEKNASTSTALTNAMFFHAPNTKKTEDPPAPRAESTTTHPYFRVDLAFTADMLAGTTAYEFFFNRTAFIVGVGASPKIDVKDPRKVQKTARENVMFMLKSLFTTSFPIEDNLENSYDANIQKTSTQIGRTVGIPELLAPLFPATSSTKFTHLVFNGIKYTLLGVMWINDVVNHSRYRQLMKDVVAYQVNKKKKLETIEKKLNELATQFTEEKLTEWLTFMNTKNKNRQTSSDDVGEKPIQNWLDRNEFDKKKFKAAWNFKAAGDETQTNVNKRKLLTEYVAPYLNEFHIQQMIITDLVESRRPKTDSKRLLEFLNDPNFREMVSLSREFYTQSKLKSFFTSGEEPKLLTPVYTKTVTALTEFQSALTQDSEFCDMMAKVLEMVPDNILELPKNANAEYNPILKKLKQPDAAKRLLLSTNNNLQLAIEEYLRKGCSDASFETFASQLEDLYFSREEGEEDTTTKNTKTPESTWMTTDVVQQTKDMFAIEVQLELMQGLLDDGVIQQITCAFGNQRLETEYDRLKHKLDDVPLYLQQPKPLFSVETFLKPPPSATNLPPAKKTGGTRRRRYKRRSTIRRRYYTHYFSS